jgi:hypothetical protein
VTPGLAMLHDVVTWAAQVTDPDYIDEAGRIIGSPAAGPAPQNPGDRGGYAQILTLFVMLGGVSFVAWRIRHAMQNARPTSPPPPKES